MRTASLALAAAVLTFSSAWAGGDKPARPRPGPVRIARPARPVEDLLKGAVDPYDAAAERARFFRAAGVDNELERKEFDAARAKKDSFVRRFDQWQQMLAYDKDHNGTIDWFEADAYRKGIRESVVKAFDENKDGQLKDTEREKANRQLATGRLPHQPGGDRRGHGGGDRRDRGGDRGGRDSGNRRGRGGGDRRSRGGPPSVAVSPGKPPEGARRHEGKPDEKQRAAMQAAAAEREKRMQEFRQRAEQRRKEMLGKYDADHDGKFSDGERQVMQRAMREQWMIRRHDKDGDGKLNDQERAAMSAENARMEEQRRSARERFERLRSEADTNGDGQASPEEWQAYRAKARAKYDADGDGQLNAEERSRMVREMHGGMVHTFRISPGGTEGRGAMIRRIGPHGQMIMTSGNGSPTVIIRRMDRDDEEQDERDEK